MYQLSIGSGFKQIWIENNSEGVIVMLKKLILVIGYGLCQASYTAPVGWYGGIIGSRGVLYDSDTQPSSISGDRSGLLLPTWKVWDMGYMRYQRSKQWAVILTPRLKFGYRDLPTPANRKNDIHGYQAYFTDIVGARHIRTFGRKVSTEGQIGLWIAQSDVVVCGQQAEVDETNRRAIPGYGAVIGIGANWEVLPRVLIEGAWKGLWSFYRMQSTTIAQVGISYRWV